MEKFNFLPEFILENYKKKQYSGEFYGSSLIVDIEGFTTETENLFKKGDDGAEEISLLLQNVFKIPIEEIYSNNGFITSFAGDAFIAVFPDDKGKNINRVVRDIIKNQIKEKIKLKIGIGIGEIEWGIVGTEFQKTYYFSGKAIEKSLLNINKKLKNLKTQNIIKHKEYIPNIKEKYLKYFFSEQILKSFRKAELRYITPVFIKFGENKNYYNINIAAKICIDLSKKFKGTFNKIDVSDKGVVGLIIFGAPESRENSEISALRFAKEIVDISKNISIGIDYGFAYTGLTGSDLRNEWTVIGDIVNTSARLMSLGKYGEILISKRFYKRVSNISSFEKIGDILLKGKNKEEEIYKFKSFKNFQFEAFKHEFKTSFVGREDEINKIKNIIDKYFLDRESQLVKIFGEAGIGKTRLLYEVINRINKENFNIIYLRCDQTLPNPWNPLQDWLKNYFNIQDNNSEDIKNKIFSSLKDISTELSNLWSYAGAIIGYYWKNSAYEIVEDLKLRVENQKLLLRNIIFKISEKKPVILIIDDFQWIDELSKSWIEEFLKYNNSPLFIILSRDSDNILINVQSIEINIESLSENNIKRIFISQFDKNNLKEFSSLKKYFNNLIDRVQGNPFFSQQLIIDLKDRIRNTQDKDIEEIIQRLPSSLFGVLTSRIDKLDSTTKEFVKKTSVIGSSIFIAILKTFYKENNLEDNLKNAINENVLKKKNVEIISFTHNLLQEASYQLLLPSLRIQYHRDIVDILEDLFDNINNKYLSLLCLHTKRAEYTEKWIYFINKYGEYLKNNYANNEALKIYFELAQYYKEKEIDDELIKINKIVGEIYLIQGKNDLALEIFQQSLEKAKKLKNNNLELEISIKLAEVFKKVGNIEKAENLIVNSYKISEKINSIKDQIDCLSSLGVIQRLKGKNDDAIKNYIKALELSKREGFKKKEIKNLINLGLIHIYLNKIDLAEDYLQSCFEVQNIEKEKMALSGIYNNLGIIWQKRDKLNKALEYFEKSLKVKIEIGDYPGQAVSKYNIGDLYIDLGEKEKADKFLKEALKIYKDTNIKYGEMETNSSLGALYEDNLHKALLYYNAALKIAEKFNYQKNIIVIYYNIAESYKIAENKELEKEYLDKAMLLAKEKNDLKMQLIISKSLEKLEKE